MLTFCSSCPSKSAMLGSLPDGPLYLVLSYLDAKDLSTNEQTCRRLRQSTALAWQRLDASLLQSSDVTTPKHRCQRFYKAHDFALRMESLALHHFDYDDPERSHTRCGGCRHFPNLQPKAIRREDDCEFFVRLAYRKPEQHTIWQGFVQPKQSSSRRIHLPMANVSWPALRSYLRVVERYDVVTTDHPELLALLYEAMDNLIVTVVALERVYPWRTHLVVATGGFYTCIPRAPRSPAHVLNPRNVSSHSFRKDEDWMETFLYTNQVGLESIAIAHEW